ncbi:Gldg family protein [Roseiconus lacunae]|uniref:Gldg family protein n=1 Tax=Roseiconus lacunae TaxID=2605694 RepID=A0ABT7PHS8_9BACT|nr:Gldg family protein [Roseiconus lacunae]MCD0461219.1 Gldg family protein [Roseiconus lacunae]MDM4016045.1 Gldg family protein [Roseiconus lacunae]WRQ51621.1 Gldg family protein [Stieleria sp. HD01]
MNDSLYALLNLVIMDAIFMCVVLAIFGLIAGTKRAAFAVMKRNFVGYFSNPTGYVFLCIFVFLTSVAAFWPYEFFNQNLATLDQLNYWYPLIMLVFIPAITMSIWAEEKRAGTDELLLTLPADDFDIVIGKYMAAAAIFTASLLFSQLSTFVTLTVLTEGSLDTGLIFSTYIGYWFVGITMIAIGMVASFLTGNLTVGFVLGALFNAPLAFASLADSVVPNREVFGVNLTEAVQASGIARPFDDFGRGVISVSSITYFVLVTVVALYACMVLIGRRHWTGGKDGNTMAYHYVARILALILITTSAVALFRHRDPKRFDMTEGKVSSLAPATSKLIRNLESDRPIKIDAFISKDIPEMYARTRYELINLLKEFRSEAAANGRTIEVNLQDDIDLFSEEAALASERFGIEPVTRMVREQGSFQQKRLIMGAAFRAGLEKVVVPIFEYGIPVEYELVRSINTVARGERKRLGVVRTDAQLMGGVSMAGMQMRRIEKHPLIDELSKQYDVEEINLDAPVDPEVYDALLVVQPSSLAPPQFERLLEALQSGIPTAIFEDPFPFARPEITATGSPKQSGGGMFGGGGQQPKGDIRELWNVLQLQSKGQAGVPYYNCDIVWQDYNPYPNLEMNVDPFWAFIDENAPGVEAGQALSSQSPITDGLRQVLALYGGTIAPAEDATLKHTPLLSTGAVSGTLNVAKLNQLMQTGMAGLANAIEGSDPNQVMAMTIEGEAATTESSEEDAAEGTDPETTKSKARSIKAAYVADTDLMLEVFLQIRADPNQAAELRFQFQNVTFLLNIIDWLTGETDFIEVRKHEPHFASLRMIDTEKEVASREVRKKRKEFQEQSKAAVREAEEAMDRELQDLQEEIQELRKKSESGNIPQSVMSAKSIEFQTIQSQLQRALDVKRAKAEREGEQNIARIQRESDQKITAIQNQVKAYAVALPCIPPLVVGVCVFASRRLREREHISKARLK